MKSPKHTKWKVESLVENDSIYPDSVGSPSGHSQTYIVDVENDRCIAITQDSEMDFDSGIETAHLIAAAPEMLEALEKIAHDIEALKHSTNEADFPLELAEYSTSYIEPLIASLIKKARGDS